MMNSEARKRAQANTTDPTGALGGSQGVEIEYVRHYRDGVLTVSMSDDHLNTLLAALDEAERALSIFRTSGAVGLLARAEAAEARATAAEAVVASVQELADDPKRHLVRWVDDSHLVDLMDLRAALTPRPSPAPVVSATAEPTVVSSGDEASVGEATRCRCGSDATSLNPAEVVVHRSDGPCYIAASTTATAMREQLRKDVERAAATPDHMKRHMPAIKAALTPTTTETGDES